jgi:hypothetical protein
LEKFGVYTYMSQYTLFFSFFCKKNGKGSHWINSLKVNENFGKSSWMDIFNYDKKLMIQLRWEKEILFSRD